MFTGCSPGTGSYRPSFLPAASLKPLHKIQEGKFHYLMRSKRSKEAWQSVCVWSAPDKRVTETNVLRLYQQYDADIKEIILTLFSLGGFSSSLGVRRLTWCLVCDIGAFILQRGRGTGTAGPTFSVLSFLTRIYRSPVRVGGCLFWQRRGGPCGPRGPPRATNIPGKLKETVWILWARLDIESCIKRQSRTGNITTDLGDPSCHCACNQGWYENMKINNSMLLFSGRRAFLFITLFIVGCHKYSRMIIAG